MRSGFWRKCRTSFRWLRIILLLLMLTIVCAVVWLNQVGLPDFVKARLVNALHERGIELEFSRLRLGFARGLVAENVHIGDLKTRARPALSADELRLKLNFSAFLHRRLQVDGFILRQGKLILPLTETNGAPRSLALNNIQTTLRLQTNDTWTLDNFQADFAGAKLNLSGGIVHAPELRNWEMFHRKRTGQGAWETQLQKFSDTLERIHFTGAPQLRFTINGDARDIHSFVVSLAVNAPGAQTPWGSAREIQFLATLTAPVNAQTNFAANLAWWTNALPYQVNWKLQLAQLHSEKVNADFVSCDGFWFAPELAVTNLSATLGGGELDARARLNVASREFTFANSSCFDVHTIAALLTEKTRARLAEISWTQPPSVHANGSLILPPWVERQPDWRGEVRQTVKLSGELAITNGAFQGVGFDSARTHFSYTNLVWELPDFALTRAATQLKISGNENDGTKDYHWRIHGAFDPESVRPFLTSSNAARGFKIVAFVEPLIVDAKVNGRLYDYDSISANGQIALTNFSVRGETFGDVTAAVNYTNRVLEFLNPLMHTGDQMVTADKVTLDFNERMVYFTNGFSIADPRPVARAIGPKTGRIVEPYHFLRPPVARINGRIPLHDMKGGQDMEEVDLQFDIITNAPFQWLKLTTPGIKGTIHWQGQWLYLTNVAADFYGGKGKGFAGFDFRVPHEGADYSFTVDVTNVDLHLLAADLSSPTNRLEGILAGQVVVTSASSRNLDSWDGFGHANLRNGLLWDVPIFGILSPVLNAVAPGLGSSRATSASARFIIVNGVFFTDSLEIRSTMARLQYAGSVDLKENVNARVTAQLLRDTPLVGPLISTVLWPVSKVFEYKVTGTLKEPKSDPIYVPKFLLMPLHPIRTLEGLIPGGTSTGTNAPAEN